MTKLYFLGMVSLSGLLWFGLDRYMTAKKLLWGAVADVWPFWLLMITAGFLLGGFVWGIIAQAAIVSDTNALNAQFEADKKAHAQTVKNNLRDERAELTRQEQTLGERVKLAEQALDAREQAIEDKLKARKRKIKAKEKAVIQTQADAEQLIIDTKTENEGYRLRALNASKALERARKQHKAALAKLEQGSTE